MSWNWNLSRGQSYNKRKDGNQGNIQTDKQVVDAHRKEWRCACVGTEKVIAFIEEHKDWIEQARKKTYERQKQRAEFYNKLPLTTRAQADEALKRLKALVEPMMEKHAKEMGVKPSIVYYKPTISRWGQCNVKDRSICISAYVLLLPKWCVEHVVVHELCHLLEPSHNARFHALMDKYFPRWREARKETHKICKLEENEEDDDDQ